MKRVLDSEPALTRYCVTLPIDLPAGDTDTRSSAQTRWDEKVVGWRALAAQRGMTVEFVLLGAHELVSALTLPENEGRARYWFGADVLTDQWQRRRLEEAVTKAGRRYTPKLHVEVHTVQALHAVGRSAPYVDRWRVALAELREARRWGWRSPRDQPVFDSALARCSGALTAADASLATMIAALGSSDDLPALDQDLSEALASVAEVDDLLRQHCLTKDRYYVDDAATLSADCARARSALWQAQELAGNPQTRAADTKRLVITGRAGTGKTHLFCDVALRRLDEGRSTLLLLGQDFDTRNLLSQFADITQLDGPLEAALACFAAAAEASGHLGLVMIDALNESDRPERWPDDLRALLAVVNRYENIAVAVSCRTEFVDAVLGAEERPTVEHLGFAEATDRAISRYAEEYGLEPPTFPILGPEFGNPLFLKLTCEALSTLGAARFPFGSAGVTTVCEAFLDAVNRRLSASSRCDYDPASDPVAAVVRDLASLGGGPYDRADVRRLTESIVPGGGQGWSRSLLRGLIAEGVLIEAGRDRVAFGYQRLGDLVRATHLAKTGLDAVRTWFQDLGDRRWSERGLLGALAVVMPEQHGTEFAELVADVDGRVPRDVVDAFLESLLLRGAESITPRAVAAVENLLDDCGSPHGHWEIWDRLLRVACIPGHPLNAEWLHDHLQALELSERDATWSQYLVGALDDDRASPLRRLVDWAWPDDLDRRQPLTDDVAALATTCLGWLLTTTDRRVRDRATKALTSVAERAPAGFATGLARFCRVNDPYVTERLAGAACGATLRTDDAKTVRSLADGVSALLADVWPDHLLTRDYARHVVDAARAQGWAGSLPSPAPGAWPIPARSAEEIEAIAGPPDYAYSSIWYSLTGMGDFGRYILTPALDHIATDDEQTLARDVERALFDRVLDLGWTPERFKNLDKGHHGGHDGVVERVGKKYQWIAFYEVLGRLTDHHLVRPRWGDSEPRPYEHAEHLVWRDIDPTVLVRKPRQQGQAPWFAPVAADLPVVVADEYPSDMAGVPDPLDLIAVTDPDGTNWLTLVGNHTWEQPLPVEVVAQRVPRLVTWMQLHSYLVPVTDNDELVAWTQGQGLVRALDARHRRAAQPAARSTSGRPRVGGCRWRCRSVGDREQRSPAGRPPPVRLVVWRYRHRT